ncbi:MAG: hypothetical protein ACK5NE_08460 [Brachymonas sp.]
MATDKKGTKRSRAFRKNSQYRQISYYKWPVTRVPGVPACDKHGGPVTNHPAKTALPANRHSAQTEERMPLARSGMTNQIFPLRIFYLYYKDCF